MSLLKELGILVERELQICRAYGALICPDYSTTATESRFAISQSYVETSSRFTLSKTFSIWLVIKRYNFTP